jgi:hypothetical protein
METVDQERAGRGALYKVAYDEAARALSEQQALIESVRGRAGLLFSAAAVTTSFLGAQALEGGLGPASWIALGSFVGIATFSLAILWPRHWEFTTNPGELIRAYIEAETPAPIDDLRRDLALHMHRSYGENREGLAWLATLFQIASGLLIIEVILWIITIASTA